MNCYPQYSRSSLSCPTRLLLCLLTLALLLPSLYVLPTRASQPHDTDYRNPSSPVAVTLSASQFTALLAGKTLPEVEQTYLDTQLGNDVFSYSDAIPPSCVTLSYQGASLSVKAKVYRYTAANGTVVAWHPTTATVASQSVPMSLTDDPDTYRASFSSLDVSQQNTVKVDYCCYLTIPAAIADHYRNYTYRAAYALWSEHRTYEEYQTQLAAYRTYLQAQSRYETDLRAWEIYAAEKAKYDIKDAAYRRYLEELAAYEEALRAYEAYLQAREDYDTQLAAYEQYLTDLADYDQRYLEYQHYRARLEQVQSVLTTMESIYATGSDGTQLYATLMGGTVDMVLDPENQKLLIANGVSPTMIAQADRATTTLKTLLSEYASKSSIAEKLVYYQAHYTDIRDNMASLYGALHTFIDPAKTTVANAIMLAAETRGKLDRYVQLVAQLYVVCTGLDDHFARDPDWSIVARYQTPSIRFVSYTYTDLLDDCQLPSDINNADPSSLPALGEEVAEPSYPEAKEKPTLPIPVRQPIAPDVVLQPTPPTYVEKPIAPVVVSHPGEAPSTPSYTASELQLIHAIDHSTLRYRSTGSAVTLCLQTDLSLTAAAAEMSVVTFYDHDGKTVLYEYTLPQGAPIAYRGDSPTRAESAKYTYRFFGWKTADGADVTDFGTADTPNIAYYAAYTATLRHYTVTFSVDGVLTKITLPYGEIPLYNGTPEKPQDEQNIYTFATWSPALAPVSGDITYEAVFRSTQRQYTVSWVVNGTKTTEVYAYGEQPSYPGTPHMPTDSEYIYTFRAWDAPVTSVTGDVTYTAQFDAVAILPDAQGAPIPVTDTGAIYTAALSDQTVQIDRLVALALAQDRTVELTFDDGGTVLQFNEALLTDLQQKHCLRLSLSATDDGIYALLLTYSDAQGTLTPAYPLTIQTSCRANASAATCVYQIGDHATAELPATFDATTSTISVKCIGNVHLQFQNEYTLTHTPFAPEEPAALISLPARLTPGETITLAPRFEDGYRMERLTVIGESGTEYPVTVNEDGKTYTFLMPAENITVYSQLSLQEYLIRFVVDGVVIHSAAYHKGDLVTLPSPPTKAQQGDLVYTFSAWTPTVTTVTGDATYTAVFTCAPIGGTGVYVSDPGDGFPFLIVFGSLFLLLLAGALFLLIRHRKKKRLAGVGDTARASLFQSLRHSFLERALMNVDDLADAATAQGKFEAHAKEKRKQGPDSPALPKEEDDIHLDES